MPEIQPGHPEIPAPTAATMAVPPSTSGREEARALE
jgi:hypothetical protein